MTDENCTHEWNVLTGKILRSCVMKSANCRKCSILYFDWCMKQTAKAIKKQLEDVSYLGITGIEINSEDFERIFKEFGVDD